MQQSAVELIKAFKEAYHQFYGRYPRVQTRKGDGKPKAYERWVELAEWLNLQGIAPCVYFNVIFTWLQSKNLKRSHEWVTNLTARDIVKSRLKVQNRKMVRENPWPTLKEAILTDIRSNFDLVRQYQKTYRCPQRTRQVLASSLTPYFWVFDPWYVHGKIELPESHQMKVWKLYEWFLSLPNIMREISEAYHELAAQ